MPNSAHPINSVERETVSYQPNHVGNVSSHVDASWRALVSFKTLMILGLALIGQACTGDGPGPSNAKPTISQPEKSVKGVKPENSVKKIVEKAAQASEAKSAPKPVQLAFFDSRIFDDDLSGSMSRGSESITVDAPAGFTLNRIPERVDRWLYSIKENGGKVVAKPEHQLKMRGIFGAFIDVVVAIFEKIDEMALYQPSEKYNATLLYRPDGTVSKVVFEKRYDRP